MKVKVIKRFHDLKERKIQEVGNEEFGTGPKGQENHTGISPDADPVYKQSPWWIHESQIEERVAEKYHMFHIDTEDGKFYQSSGRPAHPFMYPALKDSQGEILKDFAADFTTNLEGILKK